MLVFCIKYFLSFLNTLRKANYRGMINKWFIYIMRSLILNIFAKPKMETTTSWCKKEEKNYNGKTSHYQIFKFTHLYLVCYILFSQVALGTLHSHFITVVLKSFEIREDFESWLPLLPRKSLEGFFLKAFGRRLKESGNLVTN